jgi:glycosyltransferase involved in cell wall biosynthesis
LLGCDLILNDFVQHKNEEWFDTDELEITVSYLYMCRERFWNGIKHVMSYRPTISGYTTTYNCINNDYPYIESITSLLRFCDEVIVVDAGSTDETLKQLKKLAEKEDKLKVFQKKVDFSKPRWAVEIDGHLKAYARALCKAQFCWQQDSDEVVHEEDYEKIYKLVKNFPKSVSIICLPVIEYFGSVDKVRSDVAWKWRLSRNLPEITHDVPLHYREFDSDGNVYPQPFKSDTCDYVDVNSYLPIKTATFYPAEADIVRQSNIEEYEKWFDKVIQTYPSVFHFSWLKIERKVRNYLGNRGWQSFHASMFNLSENTPMFDHAPTEDEIKQKVKEIKEHGPHIFHRKMSDETKGKVKTISVSRTIPEIVKDWVNDNK